MNKNIEKCREIERAWHAGQITYDEFNKGWADAEAGRVIGGVH